MSKYVSKENWHSTTFTGRSIEDVLQEVVTWLHAPANVHTKPATKVYNNAHYYIDMVTNYDGEYGYSITIYHAEIK